MDLEKKTGKGRGSYFKCIFGNLGSFWIVLVVVAVAAALLEFCWFSRLFVVFVVEFVTALDAVVITLLLLFQLLLLSSWSYDRKAN